MKKTILTVLLLAFAVSAAVWAQTGSGVKNYVVTIEGWWAGPAGDARAGKPVYGTYTISARSETEALSEARSQFRGQYPNYRNIGETVVNTTPTNTRPMQKAMFPSSGSAPSSQSAPSAPSAPVPVTSAQVLILSIADALGSKNYDAAIHYSNEGIRLYPNDALYYFGRGEAYHYKGDYDRAIADYTSAIRLDPNRASYYKDRGDVYYGKRDYDRAIDDYTSAIRLDPKLVYAHSGLRNAYNRKNNPDAPEGQLLFDGKGNKVINGVKLEVFDGALHMTMTDTNSDNVILRVVYVLYFADGSNRGPSTSTLRRVNGRQVSSGDSYSSARSRITAAEIIEVSAESQP